MFSAFIYSWFFVLGFLIGFSKRPKRIIKKRVYLIVSLSTEEGLNMDFKVNDQRTYTLQAKDEFGNVDPLPTFDSPPAWSVSDSSMLSIAPSADGLSATITSPAGKLGAVQVQFSGSVAGQQIQGSDSFSCIAGDVASITLVAGQDTPAPAPAQPDPAQPTAAPAQ